MNRKKFSLIVLIAILSAGIVVWKITYRPPVEKKFAPAKRTENAENETKRGEKPDATPSKDTTTNINLKQPDDYKLIPQSKHIYQTFNNCGPATLSMILDFYGEDVSQDTLGNQMRPYQNPQGDNDDKTIFSYEFVEWAEKYDLMALERINGDIELLKLFVVNDIPVVVKTWLNPNEDIGHFRIVRGFDENKGVIIQDDSYQGPNKLIKYYDFLSMWQPFNYNYMIVYNTDMENTVQAIIGEEMNKEIAWKNSIERAMKEKELEPNNPYPSFNLSTSYYHLGEYEKSIENYEAVADDLPRRMLWYQIEPIKAYKELENYDRVFEISNNILNNGNRAFSELYQLQGEIHLEQGNIEEARENFKLALRYNENYEPAQTALESL